MIFVMNGQLPQFFSGKITTAFSTDPRENLQRLLSILSVVHSLSPLIRTGI
jgi:hypothetical protein